MLTYEDLGYTRFLEKPRRGTKQLTPLEVDQLLSEVSGEKVINYTTDKFLFIPTQPSANPKEGDMYYDKEQRKLQIYTGSAYETITSS